MIKETEIVFQSTSSQTSKQRRNMSIAVSNFKTFEKNE